MTSRERYFITNHIKGNSTTGLFSLTTTTTTTTTKQTNKIPKKIRRYPLLTLCEGNPQVIDRFSTQRARNVESVSTPQHLHASSNSTAVYLIGCLLVVGTSGLQTKVQEMCRGGWQIHYTDVIMTTMASQITSLTVVYSIVYSGADQRKHQNSASLASVRGIHRDRWIPRTKGQ